jgi:Tol biopolymer transport system component
LCDASFFWPARLRFSPDDRTLLAIDNLQLELIDVATGTISYPLYTNSAVTYADWSPDGKLIAYHRANYDPDAPLDSSYLHVLDLTTSTDRPVLLDGQLVSEQYLRFAPDGRLAAIEELSFSDRVVLIDLAAQHETIVYDTGTYQVLSNLQWLWRPSGGVVSLVFAVRSGSFTAYAVNPDGSALRRLPEVWSNFHMISPDGKYLVTPGADPETRAVILDISQFDDLSGATLRHLTRFSWPTSP